MLEVLRYDHVNTPIWDLMKAAGTTFDKQGLFVIRETDND